MKRTVLYTLLSMLLLGLVACGSDPTSPGGGFEQPEPGPQSTVTVSATSLDVPHDCDEESDNPGDFKIYVVIKRDASPDPGINDWRELDRATGTKAVHAGDQATINVSASATVARLDGERILLQVWAEERDSGTVDAVVSDWKILRYSEARECWVVESTNGCGAVSGTAETFSWSEYGHFRNNNIFSPGDEGCEFTLRYGAHLTL